MVSVCVWVEEEVVDVMVGVCDGWEVDECVCEKVSEVDVSSGEISYFCVRE